MPDPKFAPLGAEKYISLETFKKNGEGVRTPVWFVSHNGALYVYTEADSWKVKRIRNTPRVRVAVCNVRGTLKGEWVEGAASFVDGAERTTADELLTRKYWSKRLLNLFARVNRQHERAMIRIDVG